MVASIFHQHATDIEHTYSHGTHLEDVRQAAHRSAVLHLRELGGAWDTASMDARCRNGSRHSKDRDDALEHVALHINAGVQPGFVCIDSGVQRPVHKAVFVNAREFWVDGAIDRWPVHTRYALNCQLATAAEFIT
jgi:hypothetical protein